MHSAAWKDEYDLKGKDIAVLGCGSSGVQIIPTVQPGKKRTSRKSKLLAQEMYSRQVSDDLHPNSNLDHRRICTKPCGT